VAAARQHAHLIKTLRHYHADPYCENKEGKTALDLGQDGDDVKEALLSHRFTGEELEDEFLQDRLPPLVERATSPRNHDDLVQALFCLRAEIRTATSSMTSVPKPLKILRDKFEQLKEAFDKMPETPVLPRALLSDILSVLAITVEDSERLCLKCRLAGTGERISSFGHPYISRICTQIPGEWQSLSSGAESSLLPLVHSIVVYCLDHSSESEAVDLLMEIDHVPLVKDLVKEDTYQRVCLYLTSCVKYVPEPEDGVLLTTALEIYRQFDQFPHALRLALMLNDAPLTKQLFLGCTDRLVRKQLAFMLGRQQVFVNITVPVDTEDGGGDEMEDGETPPFEDADDLIEIMANIHLNNNFLALARELDIMEPKVPEDIYKTHLEHVRFSTAGQVDSAQGNLASSFVNGFVNCGFGVDKLLTEDGNKWIYKNKGVGMLSATASIGLVLLWDVEGGLTEIDKFLYSNDESIKAGALLACGIVNCGVSNECDPALALLSDYVKHKSVNLRLTATMGLGLAYAGSAREDVLVAVSPGMDSDLSPDVVGLTALSLGLIAVGTGHGELTESLVQTLLDREGTEVTSTWNRFLALGLALVYLGRQEGAGVAREALNVVAEPLKTFAITLLDICAYAGPLVYQ
jgi:26S proteasome regulatory subunit N1